MVAHTVADGPVVLWGAGLQGRHVPHHGRGRVERPGRVDINPDKRGRYVPISGHAVVAPADLVDDPPATAIVVNPVYVGAIGRPLADLGLRMHVVTIEEYVDPITRPDPARIG